MKKILLLLLPAVLFFSCDSENKAVSTEAANDAKVKSAATPPPDPFVQKMESLKSMPAIGLDQLSVWVPATLNGIKRSNLTVSSDMGYAVAHADYEKNSKTDMRITVYDCAGDAGSALYSTHIERRKKSQETEEGYTKTIDFLDDKAIEQYDAKNKITTLTFMTHDRLLMVISARNLDPETVREAAKSLAEKPV